jgi:hypothetical protein
VEIQYEAGTARHKLFLAAGGNHVTGSHEGWAYQGALKGEMDGDRVALRSSMPVEGTKLSYTFRGSFTGGAMSGELELGEYGRAKWKARRA